MARSRVIRFERASCASGPMSFSCSFSQPISGLLAACVTALFLSPGGSGESRYRFKDSS
nr:hypothetical protein [Maridesulfovibrio sp.]